MKTYDKIKGAVYGMALGDSFGMPAELWGRKAARKFFKKPITELLDGPKENDVACNYKKGQFTDDTGQALVILDSINETDFKPDVHNIAMKLIDWAVKENAWDNNILGPTSKVALANIRDEVPAGNITDKALSNGSAMRIAPIGCLFLPSKKQEIVDYVFEVSKVTHSSDVTIAGAAMIAMGVASAIVNDDFEQVLQDMLDIEKLGYEKGCETFSARLLERTKIGITLAREEYLSDDDFTQKIYDVVGTGVSTIESVPAAISVAYYAKDPNKCAVLCANMGGDTDTIGAMATAICGAFTGFSKISKEYVDLIDVQNDIDLNLYVDILMEGREKLA